MPGSLVGAIAMRPAAQPPSPFAQARPARALLGVEHPLVRVLEREDVVRRDLLVVAALVVPISGIALSNVSIALWSGVAVGVTVLALACVAGALRARRREYALTLILEGRERLPIKAIAAERRRLADPGYRRTLAYTFQRIRVAAADHPSWLRSTTMIYSVRTIRVADSRIREVEGLLRGDRPATRGVALALRLLIDGGSPLHGSDAPRLCEELHRIALVLQGE